MSSRKEQGKDLYTFKFWTTCGKRLSLAVIAKTKLRAFLEAEEEVKRRGYIWRAVL